MSYKITLFSSIRSFYHCLLKKGSISTNIVMVVVPFGRAMIRRVRSLEFDP